ncbi:MAG TPA: hypothetical protein VN253_09955, partial [Kofleriaceae bacterium]|nr:hypothetical protein [Kofleriaceae bacterium]
MRFRNLGVVAAVASAGLFQSSGAVVRPKDADAPLVSAGRAPRSFRTTAFEKGSKLAAAGLSGWTAIWDRDTEVPLRLWGAGQAVVGAVADPAIAEAAARQFLAAHLGVLAPGAQVADFELISNELSRNGDVRSVGFAQRAGGVRVLGGAIGFAFKHDRLAMVSSTALPHVAVTMPFQRISPALAASRATAWLAADGFTVAAKAAAGLAPAERVIVPIVRPRVGDAPDIQYRLAEQVAVESTTGPGRWEVWIDALDGAPIARRSGLHYATGKVLFDVPDRHPLGTRSARPSILATHTVNGVATTSAIDATLTWTGTADATVAPATTGTLVRVSTAGGAPATATLTLPVGGTVTWSTAAVERSDAQLTSFIHANIVKQFAKNRLNPALAWLDTQLPVTVNENGSCNAYSTGNDLHFFPADTQCQNTGRMADVVYHEFGHSLHNNSIIPGVGNFDGALSEGVADTLASLITNDHGMGRGFFFNDDPLRDLDPVGTEKMWPTDVTGEVHDDGEIIGETLWDMRKALEAKLGAQAGFEKTLDIYYAILQRAADIPSTYAEALLADDDDGNLSNGTPNQCEINSAFGVHGLADPTVSLGIANPERDGFNISIAASGGGAGACPGPRVMSAVVDWRKRGEGATAQIPLAQNGEKLEGAIPASPEGTVVQYKVTVSLSNGQTLTFPNNPADPLYEFYVGPVEVIKCFDFESGLAGWTHGASPAANDEWEVGMPLGLGGDPKAAHGGTGVLGLDLTRDGTYRPQTQTFAESPAIDLGGRTSVRLQYYRWLGVEDGFYDKARILVNGMPVWKNFASLSEPQAAGVNHVDKEWRFADFDLSAQAASGSVKLRFEMSSDEGLDLAGWNIDDVCIVAATGAALTCGNGTVDAGESCDDGNRVDGDGCSANCIDENPGTGEPGGCCSAG